MGETSPAFACIPAGCGRQKPHRKRATARIRFAAHVGKAGTKCRRTVYWGPAFRLSPRWRLAARLNAKARPTVVGAGFSLCFGGGGLRRLGSMDITGPGIHTLRMPGFSFRLLQACLISLGFLPQQRYVRCEDAGPRPAFPAAFAVRTACCAGKGRMISEKIEDFSRKAPAFSRQTPQGPQWHRPGWGSYPAP